MLAPATRHSIANGVYGPLLAPGDLLHLGTSTAIN
jgi:phosphate-selective porin